MPEADRLVKSLEIVAARNGHVLVYVTGMVGIRCAFHLLTQPGVNTKSFECECKIGGERLACCCRNHFAAVTHRAVTIEV